MNQQQNIVQEQKKIPSAPEDFPVYLFHKGENYKTYELLGCHRAEQDGQTGFLYCGSKNGADGEFFGFMGMLYSRGPNL